MKKLILPLVLVLAAGLWFGRQAFMSQGVPVQPDIPGFVTITTAAATAAEQRQIETLTGTVAAARAVVLTARVPATVVKLDAEPGRRVQAGDLLAELDAAEILARRDQAMAASEQAARDLDRARRLREQNAIPAQDLERAETQARAAAAAAAEAQTMAGYTRIAAPFAGVVVRKHADLGDLLAPGRPLVTLEDPTGLRLEVPVPESLAGRVAVGQKLAARLDAIGAAVELPVVEVAPSAESASRSVLVKLALPADLPGLRSGLFARVDLPLDPLRVLTVPRTALVQRGQLDVVFVISDRTAHLRLVKPGAVLGDQVVIRAGISEGEAVAVEGADLLVDHLRVEVR